MLKSLGIVCVRIFIVFLLISRMNYVWRGGGGGVTTGGGGPFITHFPLCTNIVTEFKFMKIKSVNCYFL